MEVVADHIEATTGLRWPREEVEALRKAGAGADMNVVRGAKMIHRWGQLWGADSTLDDEDRRELTCLQGYHLWRLLRNNARRHPEEALAAAGESLLKAPIRTVYGFAFSLARTPKGLPPVALEEAR